MSASTAAVTAGNFNEEAFNKWKDKRKELSGENTVENTGGGDGAHTHGAGGEVIDEAPTTFKSSPAKIANVGYNYKPFKMKASGAKYNNSPIEKNFGPAKLRGFGVGGLKGGVQGDPQAKTGVGSGLNMGASVGSSPAKGWFKKMLGKAKDVATGKGVLGAVVNPVGALMRKTGVVGGEDPAQAATGGIAEAGAASAVPPHGDEAHTGSAGPVESGGKNLAGTGEGVDPAAMEKMKAQLPSKFGRAGGTASGTAV